MGEKHTLLRAHEIDNEGLHTDSFLPNDDYTKVKFRIVSGHA